MDDDLFKRASRSQELGAGTIVFLASLMLGYFGVHGAIMYLHGSRAAPADPIACAIGLLAGFGGSYLGLRMLFGWREQSVLVPTLFLLVGGIGALAGGIWFIAINGVHAASIFRDAWMGYWFGCIGLAAIALGWRRLRRPSPR